ncbi:MAG TPA: UDP-3-O-(3-hydroxymyristoyl)glucosamine N-acyltransferase, partial [Rhodospirillaceae bacterium]|nr:UDP-3-O-(3-hydroxymyristoyl)glucosamine N-acyltransferase [Rhodospirillaceae bacterium]
LFRSLVFIESPRFLDAVRESAASFILAKPELALQLPGKIVIETPTPQLHFITAIHLLYPPSEQPGLSDAKPISPSATISKSAIIQYGAVVGANAEIGDETVIGANSVIGQGVKIGARCRIGANVTISHAILADDVTVLPGARIGQDGFGFVTHQGRHVRMPQLGRVLVGRDTEIGANAAIDRGALADTVIGSHVIIDNLVMIGHNVVVGDGAILVSQSGVAGSSKLGKYAVLAAQAGVADHLEIGDFAQIGAQSGVMRDVPANSRLLGSPAQPARDFMRQVSALAKLGKNAKT